MINDPIFIGGLQRSGTSLMRAIVGSHPDVAIFEWDLQLWTHLFPRYKHSDLSKPGNLSNVISDIFNNEKVKRCDISLSRNNIEERISEQSRDGLTLGIVFRCFLEEYAIAVGRPRWGLKTPHNEFFADDIFSAYPNTRMVQLIRDPRDVAVSYQSYKGWNLSPFAHIAKWKESALLAKRNENQYKGRYLAVRYEELVKNPERVTRKVCSILNLEFTPVMLETSGHLGWKGHNSFIKDQSRHSKKISTTGIGRYRTGLQSHLVYLYQSNLRQNFLKLGYKIEPFTTYEKALFKLKLLTSRELQVGTAASMLRRTPMYSSVRAVYRSILEPIAQQLNNHTDSRKKK